jgi:UDP-N-acetylmuramate: L-alanyl-gamma-D-glutamyl-meso-diaminopimelate ligase
MASITDAPIMIIEGDEYLASPIDRRAKFLLYQPHIALISGIAWDHINVYPTFESYTQAFENLVKEMPKAGHLFFDKTDKTLEAIAESCPEHCHSEGYKAHDSVIRNGQTFLKGNDGKEYGLQVFGEHTLKNLQGALHICTQLGVSETEFYTAIQSFKGAAKRLEWVGESDTQLLYKDFAHAPSKVKATTQALKAQFPQRKLVAALELHTFSSLNPAFLPEYKGTLADADVAIIYLSEHARAIKRMDKIEAETVQTYFNHPNLIVLREQAELKEYLLKQNQENQNLLMMSSGTFDGLDFPGLATELGLRIQ